MFSISQAGLISAGTDDTSRTDGLSTGALVTITYTGQGTFRPVFLFLPPGDNTSASSLEEVSPGIWSYVPTVGICGSHRIQGIENEGKANEIRSIPRIFGIRNELGILIPAFGEGADLLATAQNLSATTIRRSENNATDYTSDSTLNAFRWTGWWRFFCELVGAVARRGRFEALGSHTNSALGFAFTPVTGDVRFQSNEVTASVVMPTGFLSITLYPDGARSGDTFSARVTLENGTSFTLEDYDTGTAIFRTATAAETWLFVAKFDGTNWFAWQQSQQ